VVLTRKNLSVSTETSIEHFAVFHTSYIDQSPPGNATATSSSHLPAEQADDAILNAVIMGLGDALVTFVFEPEQLFIFNSTAKQMVQF